MEKQAHTAEEGKQKMDEFEKECQLIIFMPQQRRNTEIRWDQPMTCCAERRIAGRLSNPLPDLDNRLTFDGFRAWYLERAGIFFSKKSHRGFEV